MTWLVDGLMEKLQAKELLVGGFNPSEKYARQIGSFPQVGMNIKKSLSCHHLVTGVGVS